jgi:hypothetical protein
MPLQLAHGMPHWASHYYRLETNSDFVIGSWAFSAADSVISLVVLELVSAAESALYLGLQISHNVHRY